MPNSSLFLVACVAGKRSVSCPAKDLYISALFTKSRRYVEGQGGPWFILSAQHGLLAPNTWTQPYDKTLHGMKADERQSWAQRVMEQLLPHAVEIDCVV